MLSGPGFGPHSSPRGPPKSPEEGPLPITIVAAAQGDAVGAAAARADACRKIILLLRLGTKFPAQPLIRASINLWHLDCSVGETARFQSSAGEPCFFGNLRLSGSLFGAKETHARSVGAQQEVGIRAACLADRGCRLSWACPSRSSAWLVVSVWEERLARAKFTAIAGDYASVLQNGLDEYLAKISCAACLLQLIRPGRPDEFDFFTGQINREGDDVMRLIWCPRVTRASARRSSASKGNGISGLRDQRSGRRTETLPVSPERAEYFPILYSTYSIPEAATLGDRPEFRADPKRGDRACARWKYHGHRSGYPAAQSIGGQRQGFFARASRVSARAAERDGRGAAAQTLGMHRRRLPNRRGVRCHPGEGHSCPATSVSISIRRRGCGRPRSICAGLLAAISRSRRSQEGPGRVASLSTGSRPAMRAGTRRGAGDKVD